MHARGPARCLATQGTAANDAELDALVTAYAERRAGAHEERTQWLSVDRELSLRRGAAPALGVIPLRGTDGVLRGLLLVAAEDGALHELRSEGLRFVAADILSILIGAEATPGAARGG